MKIPFTFRQFSLQKALWMLGENAFLCILALLGIGVLICAFLFYVYVLPAKVGLPNVSESVESVLKFRKDVFLQVIQEWKTDEERLNNADALAPRSIFRYNPSVAP